MAAIAGSVSLSAPCKARGLGFKASAPMGSKVSTAACVPSQPRATRGGALQVVAGNKNEGGIFSPLVVVARDVIGVKTFNQFRGKIIALHSQVREPHFLQFFCFFFGYPPRAPSNPRLCCAAHNPIASR